MLWSLVTQEKTISYKNWLFPIIYLGKISYPLYLLHQIFIPYIRSALASLQLNNFAMFMLLFFLVLAVVIPISVLFHQFLELLLRKPNTKPQT